MRVAAPSRLVALGAAACLLAPGFAVAVSAAAATATRTTLAAVHPVAGKPITLTATVSPTPTGGTVGFAASGGALPSCTKAAVSRTSGRATCRTTFATAGTRTVTASYSGMASGFTASTGRATVTVTVRVVGRTGSCTTSSGALTAVDFGHWSGPVVRGCARSLSTGRALLTSAGFSIISARRFPGFVCRLGSPLYVSGSQRPTPAEDACFTTAPASASWSFWTAAKGVDTWTYSPVGADSDHPGNGEVEAWTFGVGGGRPTFTPGQVRAGLPASARVRRHLLARPAAVGANPDLGTGTGYLVDQLIGGDHYEQSGAPDLGLTIDGGLALAAAGTKDSALAAITSYVKAHQNDFTALSGQDAQHATGSAVGKVALLAEVTGIDPRDFGGVDLIAGLHRLACAKADAATRCAAKGNYAYTSSVVGQSLTIMAGLRAGETDGAAIGYLESLQASGGGFPSVIPSTGSSPETDSTAMAAMTLSLVAGARARTAVAEALRWLAGQQTADGGFPGASGDSVNSAALSAQALHLDAGTYAGEIAKARAFLASAQNSDGGFDVAAGTDGSDVRASTQAASGAAGTPFGSVLDDLPALTAGSGGADYLVSNLVGGNHYTTTSGGLTYDDQGLTADGVFALVAGGGHASAVEAMVGYLAGHVDAYADVSRAFGGPYSGSLAKLALVAEATGGDPHSFGGTDLLGQLVDHVCTASSGDATCTAAGDFVSSYSAVSQALGVLALQASPVAADHLRASSPEVARLHQLQCRDGGFSSDLIAPGAACTSEVDTTGYAVQALAAVPGTDAWLGAAQHYLEQAQQPSGLYPGAAGDNSNSTAFAAQALQTLVTALYSATADPPGPKTITPVVAWQSALRGLRGLAVASGGFGMTAAATADLRASTQAVAATAQRSLFAISGARIAATPREVAPGSGGTRSPPSGGPSTAPTSVPASASAAISSSVGHQPEGSAAAVGAPADTGTPTGELLGYALVLLVAGVGLAFAGRRRVAAFAGRRRAAAFAGRHRAHP